MNMTRELHRFWRWFLANEDELAGLAKRDSLSLQRTITRRIARVDPNVFAEIETGPGLQPSLVITADGSSLHFPAAIAIATSFERHPLRWGVVILRQPRPDLADRFELEGRPLADDIQYRLLQRDARPELELWIKRPPSAFGPVATLVTHLIGEYRFGRALSSIHFESTMHGQSIPGRPRPIRELPSELDDVLSATGEPWVGPEAGEF